MFNSLRIARQPVGYRINFGHRGQLEWKRFILSDLHVSGPSEANAVNLPRERLEPQFTSLAAIVAGWMRGEGRRLGHDAVVSQWRPNSRGPALLLW